MLECIAGLLPANAGEVRWRGAPLPPSQRKQRLFYEISFRFKPVAGRIDQGAGILFNLKPNGDYLLVRANALENNLVLFKYEKGKRSRVEWIRNTPTPSGQWQDLKRGYLNGKLYLEHTCRRPYPEKLVCGPRQTASFISTFIAWFRRRKGLTSRAANLKLP